MIKLNKKPLIHMEETSEMSRTLFFCIAEIDTNAALYHQAIGDLHTQSAGEITVHLDYLSYGRVQIVRNPSAGNQYEDLEAVAKTVCSYLCETVSDDPCEAYASNCDSIIGAYET